MLPSSKSQIKQLMQTGKSDANQRKASLKLETEENKVLRKLYETQQNDA